MVVGLGLLIAIIGGFAQNAGLGIVILIVGPIVAIIYLALFRMLLEMYYAMVRMSQDIREMKERRLG